MSKREKIERRLRRVVIEMLGMRDSEVTLTASFADDLGADSIDTVELLMAIEEEFDIEISDEDGEKIATFGQALDYLMAREEL